MFTPNLHIADSRLERARPVDQTVISVDEFLIMQSDKCLHNSPAQFVVHGERNPVPVHRSTQSSDLVIDDVTLFSFPLPHMLHKRFSPYVVTTDSQFSLQFLFHDNLRSYSGVIAARNPQSCSTAHAVPDNRIISYEKMYLIETSFHSAQVRIFFSLLLTTRSSFTFRHNHWISFTRNLLKLSNFRLLTYCLMQKLETRHFWKFQNEFHLRIHQSPKQAPGGASLSERMNQNTFWIYKTKKRKVRFAIIPSQNFAIKLIEGLITEIVAML